MDNNFHIRDVGSPTALWTIPAGKKVVVDFNATWHPIGTSGLKFSQLGVKYIQSGKFVGLNAPNWRKIPSQAKEDLWAALMVCKASYLQIYCMEHIWQHVQSILIFFFFFTNLQQKFYIMLDAPINENKRIAMINFGHKR